MLAESLDDEIESTTMEEDEGKLKKLIRSTVELIKLIKELIKEFRKDVGEFVLDSGVG